MIAFKRLVRLRVLANVALGLALICWPRLPFDWLHEAVPEPLWLVRVVGIGLIYLGLAHLASAVAPTLAMSSNLFAVLGPVVPIIALVWLGLAEQSRVALSLAVYEMVFLILACSTFQRGWLADLRTKP